MTDQLAAQLATADQALTDVIATLRQREMDNYHALHEFEAHAWAGKVDELQNIRQLLYRIPFVRLTP